MMKIAAIIPARYHSTRFKGKALVTIGGIPMIRRVYQQVEKSRRFPPSHIIVATDDQRIASVVKAFGGNAVMTSPNHQSGSERMGEVLEKTPYRDFDAAINIQGDEPVISEKLISNLYDELETGRYDVVTPAYYNTSYEEYLSGSVVKVVFDNDFQALYFSRSPIPSVEQAAFKGFHQHIGMYGYLKDALQRFVNLPGSPLETTEKLEQLRFLENGIKIKVVITPYKSIGVDVPKDLDRVEKIIKEKEQGNQ